MVADAPPAAAPFLNTLRSSNAPRVAKHAQIASSSTSSSSPRTGSQLHHTRHEHHASSVTPTNARAMHVAAVNASSRSTAPSNTPFLYHQQYRQHHQLIATPSVAMAAAARTASFLRVQPLATRQASLLAASARAINTQAATAPAATALAIAQAAATTARPSLARGRAAAHAAALRALRALPALEGAVDAHAGALSRAAAALAAPLYASAAALSSTQQPANPASFAALALGAAGLVAAATTLGVAHSALQISDFVSRSLAAAGAIALPASQYATTARGDAPWRYADDIADLLEESNIAGHVETVLDAASDVATAATTAATDAFAAAHAAAATNLKFSKDSHVGEFVFGSLSGVTSKFVEHPFDTVKVQLQTRPADMPASVIGVTRTLVQRYGVRSLFAGISPPLLSSVGEHAILFTAYTALLPRIQPEVVVPPNRTDGDCYAYWNIALCGGIAGSIASIIMTPLELVKCKMQVAQQAGSARTSATTVFLNVLREGGIRAVYTGGVGTMLRESAGGAAWFGFYELVKTAFTQRRRELENNPNAEATAGELMAAGSCAGIAYNAALFPADTIKAVQQTEEELRGAGKRSSVRAIINDIWMRDGVRGFYRGLGVTLFRSIPSSALIIVTYNIAKRELTAA